MVMDSRSKVLSYRSGMYVLLMLLLILLIGGFIVYRYSLLNNVDGTHYIDEGIFYGIIGLLIATMAISLTISVRLTRNLNSLRRVARAMEEGVDIEDAQIHEDLEKEEFIRAQQSKLQKKTRTRTRKTQ